MNTNKNNKFKPVLAYCISTVCITVLLAALGRALLRSFYLLLSFDEQFCAIFKQIRFAEMRSPLLLLAVLSFLSVLFVAALWRRGKRAVTVILSIAVFLILFLLSVWLTRVNGIMFGDVVSSLIPLILGGAI